MPRCDRGAGLFASAVLAVLLPALPVLAADAKAAASQDWPCWRGPTGDSQSPRKGIRKDWSGGLKKLWEVSNLCATNKDGITWAAPVIQGDRLVVLGRTQNVDIVCCLDANKGTVLWKQEYDTKGDTGWGNGPKATPAIDNGKLYTFSVFGQLICWDLADGKKLWQKNANDFKGGRDEHGLSCCPLIHGNALLMKFGRDAQAIALDKDTGEKIWVTPGSANPAVAASAIAKIDGADQFIEFHANGFEGFDAATGKSLWQVPWKTAYDVNATTPTISGNILFATSGYGTGCAAYELSATGARELWKNKAISSCNSDPIIKDGFVYSYAGMAWDGGKRLKCVELKTGAEKWATPDFALGTLVLVDGCLLILDYDGKLGLVEATPDAYRKLAEMKVFATRTKDDNAYTAPAVAHGKVFLRYLDKLVCYDLKN